MTIVLNFLSNSWQESDSACFPKCQTISPSVYMGKNTDKNWNHKGAWVSDSHIRLTTVCPGWLWWTFFLC